MRRLAVVGLVVLTVMVGASCAPWPSRHHAPTTATDPTLADDADRIDWLANEPLFIVVRKSCRTLDVYQYGTRIRSYPAVFGLGGKDDKLYEGDRRTPVGLYAIIEKRPHTRWNWFFLLDYPNHTDVERWRLATEAGEVPAGVGTGGAVGIHGTDRPELNRTGVDWTWGCVSVDNDSIRDLAKLAPVGTLVLIQE